MEVRQKCSSEKHKEVDAISYCEQCKIFMCNKCLTYHKELFQKHNLYNLDKNVNELFINLCQKNNHEKKLEFFCGDHNELCCVCCISKLDCNEYGQHKDCKISQINNIKDEKKNKLNENMKFLQDLANNLENTINELKTIFEKINQNKEELKLNFLKIFTKIRNALNEREDEILSDIDKAYK